MEVSKKYKVRKVCLHCAFMSNAKWKYPDWAAHGNKPHPQDDVVRMDLQLSAVHIMVDLMRGQPEEQKQKLLTTIAIGAGMVDSTVTGIVESMLNTKH